MLDCKEKTGKSMKQVTIEEGIEFGSLRFIGQWEVSKKQAITVTPGAYFDIAFIGNRLLLSFDTTSLSYPHSHLWISVDDGPMVEASMETYLGIQCDNSSAHRAQIILKSTVSCNQRWYPPLDAAVIFKGYCVEKTDKLPPKKPKILFAGDSITEGVYVDEPNVPGWELGSRLLYQNDATATYGWLTAEWLGYDPILVGFGSAGVTRGGLGGVPKALESFGLNFYQSEIRHNEVRYIVLNYGVNDRDESSAHFVAEYVNLVEKVQEMYPQAHIILLQPFCGIWEKELTQVANCFGKESGNSPVYMSTQGWYATGAIHPDRKGHRCIAEFLTKEIRRMEAQIQR